MYLFGIISVYFLDDWHSVRSFLLLVTLAVGFVEAIIKDDL